MKNNKIFILLILLLFSAEMKAELFYDFYFHSIDTSNYPTVHVKGAVYIEGGAEVKELFEINLDFLASNAIISENDEIVSIKILRKESEGDYIFFEFSYRSDTGSVSDRYLTIKYDQNGFHNGSEGNTFLFNGNSALSDLDYFTAEEDYGHYTEFRYLYEQHIDYEAIATLDLPYKVAISDKVSASSFKLNESSWLKHGFDILQEFYEDSEYTISRKYILGENKLLLIKRDYESENNQWLCIVDSNNKIIDWLEVAYDNAEGFTATESTIYKDRIVVNEYNMYTNPELQTATYLVTNDGFKPKKTYIVMANNGLNVREKPSLNSAKLVKLPKGYQVKILKDTKKQFSVIDNHEEIVGSWVKIAISSMTGGQNFGYVFSGFLEEKEQVVKKLTAELYKFPQLRSYTVNSEKSFFIQGDFFGDGVEDLAIKAKTANNKTHIIFINKRGPNKNSTFKILGLNDAIKMTDYSWAGIFYKVDKGEVLWSNYEDDWIDYEDVPESKKVKLTHDAIFVHEEESCGGGFIFWNAGKFNWLQQE